MRRNAGFVSVIACGLILISSPASAGGFQRGDADNAFQIRLGGFFPDGGGDLWEENEEVFTLDADDFDAAVLGFSFIRGVSNEVELGFNIDFFDETVLSGYRDFVDEDGFSILHDTSLEVVPLTVDIRFLPGGRYRLRPGGRQVVKPVFYLGAGVGVNLWEYTEVGDFIDFSDPDLAIFPARFEDDGVAFAAHALAGVELPLGPRFNLLLEGRYSWSDDELGEDFPGFGELDLSGGSFYVGGAWRF